MAKQKEEKTNVMRILDQRGIPYTPTPMTTRTGRWTG